MAFIDSYNRLIVAIQKIDEVLSIGKSGGNELPEDNESDIDIFVFCHLIPSVKTRQSAVETLGADVSKMTISETDGKFWGVCDFIGIKETDICLMYFTVSEMDDEIESVLSGSRLSRENEYFYPVGRCATILSMHVLYDKNGYIANMQKRLYEYPPILAEKMFAYHIQKINDKEDFSRAVSRRDVLFYHAILENAIDHYLQALFALNRCYFPSRKRTFQLIENFIMKPADLAIRLLKVIELGAGENTLSQSYDIWTALCNELLEFEDNVLCKSINNKNNWVSLIKCKNERDK
jgi:hypothetical protein